VTATEWATVASLATAVGTLVLAIATFAAVRSANYSARAADRAARIAGQSARIAERSLMAAERPLLICPASGRFDLSSDNRLVAPARGMHGSGTPWASAVANAARMGRAIHDRIAQRGLDNLILRGDGGEI
jgi:hypothetical protein